MRFFIALAAMAAMVGCSKENTPSEVITVDNFTVDAKIVVDDPRVTVGGEKFTDVKWELGDKVTLASEAGAKATLSATEAGDNVRFRGEGTYAADTDTYYAIYPTTTITKNGTVTLPLDSQAGNNAAVLVAKSENVAKGVIDMTFKPANALLHVAVSGATTLKKAEFLSFDGTKLPANFTYDFATMTASTSGTIAAYSISNPKASEGFFFQLPADLNMANGYIVRLTDDNGNICSKAYNGKTFAKGTTTRVDVEFTEPSVTLGAKTSYSYYIAGQPETANSHANNIIYFDSNYATTYAGIQNAFISEVGFKVNGTVYSSTNGEVTWEKSAKKFYMSNLTDKELGDYTVEAYIVTSTHGTIRSSQILYITGLPYTLNVTKNDGSWSTSGNVTWNKSSAVRLGYNLTNWFASEKASIKKSDFKLPANVNVSVQCTGKTAGTSAQTTVFSLNVSESTIFSKTSAKSTSPASFTMSPTTCVMNASNASVECHNSRGTSEAASYVNSLFIGYANK